MFPEWFDISMSFRQKKLRRPMQRMAIRKKVKLQEITKKFEQFSRKGSTL